MSAELSFKGLKDKAQALPKKPGIYFFKDKNCTIIYIGKARSLRDRVKSYFLPTSDPKVENILSETTDFDFILTDSEREAVFLENNFIRQSQPKFNINLKDDKSFPFLKLTVQLKFPGIELTRLIKKDNAKYVGPFSPTHQARKTIHLLAKYFGIRTCKEAIPGRRKRPCLEFDIGLCSAPCVGFISESEYKENVNNALLFLEGAVGKLSSILEDKMKDASERQDFEQAAHWRDFLFSLDQLKEKPKLISLQEMNEDIFGFAKKNSQVSLYVFMMRKGKVIESDYLLAMPEQNTPDEKILTDLVIKFYKIRLDFPDIILLPFPPRGQKKLLDEMMRLKQGKMTIQLPQRGKKKRLIELANKNAANILRKKTTGINPLIELQTQLKLDNLPRRIEGYDISNTGGEESVGSLVVFENGEPLKNDYRKFKIRSVQGADDVLSLKEVLQRRYSKVRDGGELLPDLILVDGGKGQLSAAVQVLKELDFEDIPVVSLAKKEEVIFSRLHKNGLKLDKTSPALQLLQRVRDEAHRFAITYHRKKREKRSFSSLLDDIPGVGKKRKALLQNTYKSIEDIKNTPQDELARLIGKKAAAALKKSLI
ncbi:MAG: excinuclease ABC subunit UvrC [Candidatus Aminicenantes bacterium]|nr:excinuclease ABC subunit UvrC [Candidatus Aminicenantes bacterium]